MTARASTRKEGDIAVDVASTDLPIAAVAEQSPALLRQVNELMREGRRGDTEQRPVPFFCECGRAGCFEPVWLTPNAYDERRVETHEPLILSGHEKAIAEAQLFRTIGE
jgi:hypothetical protein